MPSWVIQPQDAMFGGRLDDLQREWQESRSVVGRIDGILVDVRKYGLGLASGLLTANGLLSGIGKASPGQYTIQLPVVAALVSVTMLLVAVLFVVDRYYSMLQWAATNRAVALERALSLSLTDEILRWTNWEGPENPKPGKLERTRQSAGRYGTYFVRGVMIFVWQNLALIQYGSFIVIAAALGIAVMGGQAIPSPQHAPANWMFLVLIASFALMLVLHWLAREERLALARNVPTIVTNVRIVTCELSALLAVDPGQQEAAILDLIPGGQPLKAGDRILAITKPTAQGKLAIIAGSCQPPERVAITFSNLDTVPITPTQGEQYQAFVY